MDVDSASDGSDATAAEAKEAFAGRLRALLSGVGWSQADLSRRASASLSGGRAVAPYDVSNYLAGRSLPRAGKLAALAAALGVEPEAEVGSRVGRGGGRGRSRGGPRRLRDEDGAGRLVPRPPRAPRVRAGCLMALLSEPGDLAGQIPGDPDQAA